MNPIFILVLVLNFNIIKFLDIYKKSFIIVHSNLYNFNRVLCEKSKDTCDTHISNAASCVGLTREREMIFILFNHW